MCHQPEYIDFNTFGHSICWRKMLWSKLKISNCGLIIWSHGHKDYIMTIFFTCMRPKKRYNVCVKRRLIDICKFIKFLIKQNIEIKAFVTRKLTMIAHKNMLNCSWLTINLSCKFFLWNRLLMCNSKCTFLIKKRWKNQYVYVL